MAILGIVQVLLLTIIGADGKSTGHAPSDTGSTGASLKCAKFLRFQQPLAVPGEESTDIEPIFNNAESFEPPRPVQKFNYVNYMFKGTEPPVPANRVANATVRQQSASDSCSNAVLPYGHSRCSIMTTIVSRKLCWT